MNMDELPLLFGPYVAPEVVIGSKLFCKHRGREIVVSGLSSAPVPWPVGKSNSSHPPSIIVFGDLERALRSEAVNTVAHHFGVISATVSQWRRSLGLKGSTAGSTQLRQAVGRRIAALPAVMERREQLAAKRRKPPKPKLPPKVPKWTAEEDAIVLTLPRVPSPAWMALDRTVAAIRRRKIRLQRGS